MHMRLQNGSWCTGSFCAEGVVSGDEDTCIVLPEWAIRCGPRKTIYFDPKQVRYAACVCASARLRACVREAGKGQRQRQANPVSRGCQASQMRPRCRRGPGPHRSWDQGGRLRAASLGLPCRAPPAPARLQPGPCPPRLPPCLVLPTDPGPRPLAETCTPPPPAPPCPTSSPSTPQVSAAIVTCGGLCPGLNDVVQVGGPGWGGSAGVLRAPGRRGTYASTVCACIHGMQGLAELHRHQGAWIKG